jgi:hypothetical protein
VVVIEGVVEASLGLGVDLVGKLVRLEPPPQTQHAWLAVVPKFAKRSPISAQWLPLPYHSQLYVAPSISYQPSGSSEQERDSEGVVEGMADTTVGALVILGRVVDLGALLDVGQLCITFLVALRTSFSKTAKSCYDMILEQ